MFDAILLASYGGPESLPEVEPFLDRVLAGKRVPAARRAAVLERYALFNGISPLPEECRRFLAAVREKLEENQNPVRVYFGALYAPPFMDEAFREMERDGIRSVLVFASSAFGSAPSCRRYIAAAAKALEGRSPGFVSQLTIRHAPPCFELPEFRRSVADALLEALAWDELDESPFNAPDSASERLVLFTAHSIPCADDAASSYRRQLLHACADVLQSVLNAPGFTGLDKETAAKASPTDVRYPDRPLLLSPLHDATQIPDNLRAALRERSLDAALAFQSRSGSPFVPWLGPDVREFIAEYKEKNHALKSVVVVPLGFFFENMETIYDLDVEAQELCESLGLRYRRARCCGTADRLADAVRKLALVDAGSFPVCECADNVCDFSCRLRGSKAN